ncbi:hypothetical protein [Plasticicumulans acidivorans]|uniref:Uncharacterized protein n=1 Tax=Plasticicumulans acidivorans TaxID=886464 RepID=A0A317N0I2_9GAMM|nr:hypothetical protein [Plasticicumulans acidivorans]PWV65773.1 hypothetical protein C7443_101258 [Plasticicumulans acidivorans]
MNTIELDIADLKRAASFQLHRTALLLVSRLHADTAEDAPSLMRKWLIRRRLRTIIRELLRRRRLDEVMAMARSTAADVLEQSHIADVSQQYLRLIERLGPDQ